MRSILKSIAVIAAVFAANAASAAPTLVNGGFTGNASGWSLGSQGGCAATAYGGNYGVDGSGGILLNGCGESWADPYANQVVQNLIVGHTYTVSWDQKAQAVFGAGTGKSFGLFLGGSTPLFTDEFTDSTWHHVTTSFVATQTSQLLSFAAELDPRSTGLAYATDVSYYLDNVAIADAAAVPEPGTLALMGLGAAGLVLRRRQRASAT